MSKKAITRVQAAVVIVIIVIAGAAGVYMMSSQPSAPPPVQVKNPDTVTQETIGQPDTLDPATDYETAGAEFIQNVYEQLVFFKGAHADQVVPWLAESYDASPDGLTYTFHIRSGVTFTDGTPVDAAAVAYSLWRPLLMDDPDGPAWAMLQVIRGGQNFSKQYNNAGPSAPDGYGDTYTMAELQDFQNAKPIEVLDPMTVALYLERPYAGWPFVMAFSVTAIVSPTAFKAHWTAPTDGTCYVEGITCGDYHNELNPWPAENMVGTGPYMLKSWDKATQTLVMVRNENYWGGPDGRGKAPVANVVVKGIDNDNTRILDFKAGEADIAAIPATGGLIFQFVNETTWFSSYNLKVLDPSQFQVYPQCPPDQPVQSKCLWPSFSTFFMGFNQKIRGADRQPQAFQPFSDIRVRKAFTLAFNRTAYIHDVVQDFAIPATQIIPPGMFGYDSNIQQTPYDPDQAKQLLTEAGADVGYSPDKPQTIEISYNLGNTARETAATIIANTINSFASDTGLYARVTGLAWPQFLGALRARQLSVFFLGWIVDYVDPDDFLVPFAHASAGTFAIRMGYNNPEVTQMIDQQATIADPAQREQVIHQIENKVNDDWAFLWLTYGALAQLSRTWLHERAGASVAGGIQAYNQAIYGFYYFEIEKGSSSAPSSSPQSLFELLQQLPVVSFFVLKKTY